MEEINSVNKGNIMAKPFYWSDDKLGTLIDMYQERIYLYNTKHKDYFNRDIRNKAFSEIAKEHGTTGN